MTRANARDDFAHIDIVISQSTRNLIKIDYKHYMPASESTNNSDGIEEVSQEKWK